MSRKLTASRRAALSVVRTTSGDRQGRFVKETLYLCFRIIGYHSVLHALLSMYNSYEKLFVYRFATTDCF